MDPVEFIEPVLQKLPDASIQRFADGRVHLLLPFDACEVSQLDHVAASFFVQDGNHPRTLVRPRRTSCPGQRRGQ